MARVPEILAGALLSAVACAPVNEAPKPINQPGAAAIVTVACDPEKYAESIGMPTPVPVGGGAAPEEIVAISRKLYVCEPLSDAEREAFIKFNISHPLLATPDPAKQVVPPANTPAPAPELVLPPKPENFLPEYSVFYGQMKEENGTGRGSVIIANIPGRPEWLYAFSMANRNIGGYMYKINRIDANNLEASGNLGMVNIALAKDAKILSGSILWKRDNTSWLFEIQNSGTGREAMLEAAKKLWAREMVNNPTSWQNVPSKTVLDAMFDGKGIPLP